MGIDSRIDLFLSHSKSKKWLIKMGITVLGISIAFSVLVYLSFFSSSNVDSTQNSTSNSLLFLIIQLFVLAIAYAVTISSILYSFNLPISWTKLFTMSFFTITFLLILTLSFLILLSCDIPTQNYYILKIIRRIFYDEIFAIIAFLVAYFSWKHNVKKSITPYLLVNATVMPLIPPKIPPGNSALKYPIAIPCKDYLKYDNLKYYILELELLNSTDNPLSNVHVFDGRLTKDLVEYDITIVPNKSPFLLQRTIVVNTKTEFFIYISFTCNNNKRYYQKLSISLNNTNIDNGKILAKIENKGILKSFFPV